MLSTSYTDFLFELNVLLFTPMSITPLIDMEDARFVLNVSRPSPKAILNGEIRSCLQVICEQETGKVLFTDYL